jgi:hypothetical protein
MYRAPIAEAARTAGVVGIAEMKAVVAGVAEVGINGVVAEAGIMEEVVAVGAAEVSNNITGILETISARSVVVTPTMMPLVGATTAEVGCTTHIEEFQRRHDYHVPTGQRLFDWR